MSVDIHQFITDTQSYLQKKRAQQCRPNPSVYQTSQLLNQGLLYAIKGAISFYQQNNCFISKELLELLTSKPEYLLDARFFAEATLELFSLGRIQRMAANVSEEKWQHLVNCTGCQKGFELFLESLIEAAQTQSPAEFFVDILRLKLQNTTPLPINLLTEIIALLTELPSDENENDELPWFGDLNMN